MSVLSRLPYEWLVGLRYIRSARKSGRNRFISFISLISMAGIALGVAALIVVMSVMNGFQKEVRDKMLSVLPHIEIYDTYGSLPDWQGTALEVMKNPDVKGAAPYIMAQAMLTRSDRVQGVIVRGIVPSEEVKVSDVARQVKTGSFESLQPGTFNIVIGIGLSRQLRAFVGDKITLIAPQGQLTPAGMIPRLKQFTISGVFDVGHHMLDTSQAFISMEDGMKMFQQEAPNGLRLRIRDMYQAPVVAWEISKQLNNSDLLVRDWSRMNRNWFAAVQMEKRMMFIILLLIVAVAAFNLVSTLVMTVTEKQADIAIMRTLGASPRSIMKIFMIQGAIAGILGTLIGVSGGILIAVNIDVIVPFIESLFGFHFLPKDIYMISTLPSDLQLGDVLFTSGAAIILAFLATLYPSWSASRVNPAEALRYE
ncbi:lipoprotein-releasing ABC transporter permease subunit [Oxalobacter vibrioformis]|uniref:Lipoprotein-releasing ABC transporter permease subunit n=1 Tax=Oxalobacter vibrioformis TaxID=933080 RepID=A0A9E9LW68_9BURK|nr:lipoprotein-releasing ABC transporter permease subunit [Oxalobacter vibrioformis]WAW09964.1 lipoprotein-releasing ABC transporter permease subunit [Oxalobacter vibrioformis]